MLDPAALILAAPVCAASSEAERLEQLARFRPEQVVRVQRDLLTPFAEDPAQQLRLRAGTLLRITARWRTSRGVAYRGRLLDQRGRMTELWARADETDLEPTRPSRSARLRYWITGS